MHSYGGIQLAYIQMHSYGGIQLAKENYTLFIRLGKVTQTLNWGILIDEGLILLPSFRRFG